jgi:hypothetical protein
MHLSLPTLPLPQYAAFIGHQPHISLAELSATVPGFSFVRIVDKTVVIFDSTSTLPKSFLQNLGGTVVIAEKLPDTKATLENIPQILNEHMANKTGKVTFSLRTVGLNPVAVGKLYRECKHFLKKHGHPSRYVGNDRKAAPSIVLHDSGLLDNSEGCELSIIAQKDNDLWVGITRDAQDIESYTKRDMEKPVRDTTVGLLPPKLAQVLLNFGVWLAGGDQEKGTRDSGLGNEKKQKSKSLAPSPQSLFTVLDPFCGTGVIPMECLLRGYSVLASDSSEKAVNGCKKNIEWMRKHYNILKSKVPATVWKQDARKKFEVETRPNIVVTETTLGPNLKERPTSKDAQKMRSANDDLQEAFLESMAQSFPGVPLVVTWPVWFYSKGPIFLERIAKKAEKLGYEMVLPPHITSSTGRSSLLYRRPEQFVGREIVLLKPR